MLYRENVLLQKAVRLLGTRLPPLWSAISTMSKGHATIEVTAPDGRTATVAADVKARLDPRAARAARSYARTADGPAMVVAPWLSAATREILISEGLGFIDVTGNIRLALNDPGLYIEALGADRDPVPEARSSTLKGAKAARVVRALAISEPPAGVRELATRAGTTPGYVSKLLATLDKDAIVVRSADGKVDRVDLARLLERWSDDAPLGDRATTTSWLDPRGLPAFLAKLPSASTRYAVTGSQAAARKAPVAAARSASVYVDDPAETAAAMGLRPADAGANVLLLAPIDDLVFEDLWTDAGVRYAALPQVAADLLSGPGRGPAEAEALLAWMAANREVWVG